MEDTHKKVVFLVDGPLRSVYPPPQTLGVHHFFCQFFPLMKKSFFCLEIRPLKILFLCMFSPKGNIHPIYIYVCLGDPEGHIYTYTVYYCIGDPESRG